MKLTVTVESDKGLYHPGTAMVSLDDKLIAKLRGGESIVIETTETVSTSRPK